MNNKRGGKREGSGRKPLPFKVKTVTFRIPEDKINEAKELIKQKLSEWKTV